MTETSGTRTRTVAILGGTGNLGRGMAVRLAKAGHRVVIGSRDADRAAASATEVAQLTGSTEVTGADNGDAAAGADVVLVAVPFANQAKTLTGVKDRLREGQIVLDACVPLGPAIGGRPTQLVGVWHGSAAQQAAAQYAPAQPQYAQAPAAAPPAAGGGDDMIAKLQQLSGLHDAGVLSDEEFSAAKQKLLS